MDDGLLISQEKSYSLSSSFLLCSYNIMSKILIDAGLVMEHSKTELFHFTRACHPPNPSIDLSLVGGLVISPKPIWWYLGFYFDHRLNFNYHTHFYATKCLSTLSAMKMLGNSSRGLKRPPPHSKATLIQDLHPTHCPIWIPTVVLQGCPYR